MSDSLQVIAVLILYLILFGWVGYRRGSLRELIVAVVAIGGYLILQRYSAIVVTLVNLLYKFQAFARGGGLSGDDPDAILIIRDTANLVGAEQRDTLIFLLWVILLLFTYWVTGRAVRSPKNRSDLMAILLGMLNGIFYFSIFLPMLSGIFFGQTGVGATVPEDGAGLVLRSALDVVSDGFNNVWGTLDEQQPLIIVVFLTLVLVAVANTLRPPKAKPKQ